VVRQLAEKLAPANFMVCEIRQLEPVSFAKITSSSWLRKVIGARVVGGCLGVEVMVTGGVCSPCYKNPETTAARKNATAEKKAT